MWQELPAYDYQASRRGRSIWGWLFLLVLGLGAGGWVMLDSMKPGMVAEIPVATKPESVADTPSPEGTRIPAETPTPEPAADPAMVAAGAATEEPEIRRAEVASPTVGEIDLNAANEACRGLLEKLFQSKSQDERMKCVLNGKEHEASLKQFFTTHPEGVQIVTLRMATRTAHLFPGGRQAALFQLATNANPNGGLVRLVSDGQEGFVLDWPLFEQTHEKRLAAFVEGKDERPSAWFHVGFRRSHAFDLPVGQEEKYLALDFQASADDSLRLSALMEKQSTLGRRLEEETDWGEVYLAAFLVQRVTLAEGGKARFVVVDVRRPAEDLVK